MYEKSQYRDKGIRGKGSYEVSFTPEMLAMFQLKNTFQNPSPEYRQRVCEIFGFVIALALRYLPPKQRKIFYSVWVRSGGKVKDGILEYSRKTGQNYITNYCNYYKSVNNIKIILDTVGYGTYVTEYLKREEVDEDNYELL